MSPPPGGGGPAGGVAAVEPPIDGIFPVGEITTGGLERLQVEMSADGNQTGVPATTTPRSSFHAIIVPSWEIDGSCASPCAGRKQSLPSAGGGAPSEAKGIIAILCWPTSPASTATIVPVADTSAWPTSPPMPPALNHGVKSLLNGGWPPSSCNMMNVPLTPTKRRPASVPDSICVASYGSRNQLVDPSA